VQADAYTQVTRVRAKHNFKLLRQSMYTAHAVACEASHGNCVVLAGVGNAGSSDLAVAHGLEKDASLDGNIIEGLVQRLEESKDLRALSDRTPCGKTGNVGKHNRSHREQISDRLGLVHKVLVAIFKCAAILVIQEAPELGLGAFDCITGLEVLEQPLMNLLWKEGRDHGGGLLSTGAQYKSLTAFHEVVVEKSMQAVKRKSLPLQTS